MTFVLPGDPGFERAREARRGRLRLDARYDGFVARFAERFGAAPLWLEPDHVGPWARRPTPQARLAVVLERTGQYRSFHDRNGIAYDPGKQRAVASMFAEELAGVDLRPLFGLPAPVARDELDADGIFVCYDDFEAVATREAHRLVTREEHAGFEAALGLGDAFWCARSYAGPPIVFVRTRAQARRLEHDPARERWADEYFEVVRRHDEFGYVERAAITISVDSQEAFDAEYGGDWYAYFK